MTAGQHQTPTAGDKSRSAEPDAGRTVLDVADLQRVDAALAGADAALAADGAGQRDAAQPVHTVYLPAGQYRPGIAREWGLQALDTLTSAAPDATSLADAIGLPTGRVTAVWDRVLRKLTTAPVEDLRIDFEDGYGHPGDAVEDADAVRAGRALATDWRDGTAPAWAGIRFTSLEPATRRRGLRTLDLFLAALLDEAGALPPGLRLTLPKVTGPDQVAAMVDVCRVLERAHSLLAGSLRFELQVETPQAILARDGTATVARMIAAAEGRCAGLHYGTYDYSAALGIAAAEQRMDHPAADHAKAVMQVAAAATGVPLSDGSTNVLPVGETAAVRAAWALHARLVRRSLDRGYYQGWDLHPAQLVTRYVATYDFYASGAPAAGARVEAYLSRQAGGVLDEPATGAALAGFLLRGLRCGALDPAEVTALCGATPAQLEALAHRDQRD